MSWLKLKRPIATNVSADVMDIINAKMALNRLGYYRRPPNGIFGDWVDNEIFESIREFQKDNDLKVDGLMNPGGPAPDGNQSPSGAGHVPAHEPCGP